MLLARHAALGLALALGACASFEERHHAALNVDKRIPIEVAPSVETLDVVPGADGRLSPSDQGRVLAFMQAFQGDGNGALTVASAGGARGAATAQRQIAELAVMAGLGADRVRLATDPSAGAAMRLTFVRYVAKVRPCDDWSENLLTTYDNTPYPSFGCAMQTNFAAQVADPRDLVEARPMDPAHAGRRDAVLGKYAKGEPHGSERIKGDSGKVSKVPSGTERE